MIRQSLRRTAGRLDGRLDVVFYMPFIGWMFSDDPPSLPGGAETQMLRLARRLVSYGARVGIIVFSAPGVPSEIDGIKLIHREPYPSNQRIGGRLREAARIWRALWQAPSRSVVFRVSAAELGLVGLYTRLSGRQLVFSSAHIVDFDLDRVGIFLGKRRNVHLYRVGVELANQIVIQTEEQRPLCEATFRQSPILIGSLVEHENRELSVVPEAFLWVGRLVSYKRPQDYVALARALPDIPFRMIGVPTDRTEHDRLLAQEIVRDTHLLPNLQLLEPRPQSEVEAMMVRAVASVNTADFEGMPNVLLEAWRVGVPALVLGHDPDGIVERHGLGRFAHGSFERLVDLADELWCSRNDREELSVRCREYVESHHSPEAVTRQWMSLLNISPRAEPRTGRELGVACAG